MENKKKLLGAEAIFLFCMCALLHAQGDCVQCHSSSMTRASKCYHNANATANTITPTNAVNR